MSAARRWSPVLAATAFILIADQLSKAWAFDRLCAVPNGYGCDVTATPIDLFWTLRLNLAFNTGMAFSRGSGAGPVIGVVVVAIVVVMLLVARRLRSPLQLVLVGIVIGGALGNLVDRLLRAEDGFLSGAVVDFVDLQWWPIFNVADAAVVVGGIALALTGLAVDGDEDDVPHGEGGGDAGVAGSGDLPAPPQQPSA